MAKTQCVLDILKQNDFIDIEEENNYAIKKWYLTTKNVTDQETKIKVSNKILEKMEHDDEYVIGRKYDTSFYFTTKTAINKFVNDFLETGKEKWGSVYIQKNIANWINQNRNDIMLEEKSWHYADINKYYVINIKKQNERIEREKNNDKKVLELLDDIL